MEQKEKLVAYCGLYCGDCAGYTKDLAKAAKQLKSQIEKYKFHLTVEAMFSEQFNNYEEFVKNLEFMTQLECPTVCTQRDTTQCKIWHCCREKNYSGCYDCDEFDTCEKIRNALGELFFDACIENLRQIKAMGVREWIEKGRRYWFSCDVE